MRTIYLEPVPRDDAREEAERELSKQIYQEYEPSPFERALDWFLDRVGELLNQIGGTSSGGALGIALLVGLLVVLIVAVLIWYGPPAATKRSAASTANLEPTASEDEHRKLADAFAADGRYAEAVRERLRAIVRNLTDRGLLDNRLGRTAREVATEAGHVLPAVSADLHKAADLFGSIWYGRREATDGDDAALRAVDAKVAAARPGQGEELVGAANATWAQPDSPGQGTS